MRSGPFSSLVLALVFGALAAFLARGLIPGEGRAGTPHQFVVVADRPIAYGAVLAPENLREVPWPEGVRLEGAFGSIADVLKDGRRLALSSLGRNEPVLAGKVTPPNGKATLATQLEDGMRAVSVRVDEVKGVAGFVLPGDRVDVVLARDETGPQGGAPYADVILQNAKVVAVDQLASDRQDKPAVARAVTLEVKVADAQRVILAQGIGRLSLVLRQTGEVADGPARRITAADLGGVAVPSPSLVADLEAKLAALAEQAGEKAQENARRVADLEARLAGQAAAATMPAVPVLVPLASRDPVINVIRNGSKREQYTVTSER